MNRRRLLVAIPLAAAVASAGLATSLTAGQSSKPRVVGTLLDRPVPEIPLVDQHGAATSLAALHGRVVVVAPFLTLCHEVCPLTTGAFVELEQRLGAEKLAGRVALVEASVDPWRDSPARLQAFAKLTRVRFELLTGSRQNLARLWRFFGVFYARRPQGRPPDVDWWTHRPEAFDVEHTDGLFFLDQDGRERIAVLGMPRTGRLPSQLAGLLNGNGRRNLAAPQEPWTPGEALDDIRYLLRAA